MNNWVQIADTICYTATEVLALIDDIQKDIDDDKIFLTKIEVTNNNIPLGPELIVHT